MNTISYMHTHAKWHMPFWLGTPMQMPCVGLAKLSFETNQQDNKFNLIFLFTWSHAGLLHSCFDRSSAVKMDSHLTLGQQNPWRTIPNLTYPLQQIELIRLPQNYLDLLSCLPSLFYPFAFRIHRSRRVVKKLGRSGSIFHINDVRWTHRWGGAQAQKQHTGSSVRVLCHSAGLQMLTWSELLVLANMILVLSLVCTSPPPLLCLPCVHSWWMLPGLPLFFATLLLLCIIVNANGRWKWGRLVLLCNLAHVRPGWQAHLESCDLCVTFIGRPHLLCIVQTVV